MCVFCLLSQIEFTYFLSPKPPGVPKLELGVEPYFPLEPILSEEFWTADSKCWRRPNEETCQLGTMSFFVVKCLQFFHILNQWIHFFWLTDCTTNLFNFQAQLRGFNIKFAHWFLINFPGSNLQEKEKKRQGEKQTPGLLVKNIFLKVHRIEHYLRNDMMILNP